MNNARWIPAFAGMTMFFCLPGSGSGEQVGSAGGAASVSPASGRGRKTGERKRFATTSRRAKEQTRAMLLTFQMRWPWLAQPSNPISIAARARPASISNTKHAEIRQQQARPALFQGAHPAPIIPPMRRSLLALCLLAVSGLPAAATRPAFGDDPADSSKNPAASAPSVKTENGTHEREPPA